MKSKGPRMRKIQPIIDLIDDLHGDTSVPDTQTLEELEEIQSDIEAKIECLRDQIAGSREA